MTGAELMGVVGFFVLCMSAIAKLWWKVDDEIEKAKKIATDVAGVAALKADMMVVQLAEYKLHVSETYVSKAGHRESMEQVLEAISAVRQSIDGLSGRIDRIYDNQAKTTARART
jgi:uncharacterized lipoprotein YehR (DUF1307 family)